MPFAIRIIGKLIEEFGLKLAIASWGKIQVRLILIERFNNTLCQRVARLGRKTLSFSKKLENYLGAIAYFIHHYNHHYFRNTTERGNMEVKNNSGKCPICGYQTSPLFSVPCDYRKPIKSKVYRVEWCERCHYGQVWKRPSKAEISSYYEVKDYYTHNATNVNNRLENISFLDRLRMHIAWRLDRSEELISHNVMSLLKGDNLTICEIGCGSGAHLLMFLKKGFNVVGVEPDSVARNIAKKAIINVFNGTAEELPEPILRNKYDVILMSHVLEHCLDINATISNAKNILKHNGIFIVETPNCQSYGFTEYKGEWLMSDIPRHLNFFTSSSLNLILAKHGFSIISIKYRHYCRQFSNSWLKQEEEIWHALADCGSGRSSRPNFKMRAWKLLFKSLFSSRAFKYDSVRFIAAKIE